MKRSNGLGPRADLGNKDFFQSHLPSRLGFVRAKLLRDSMQLFTMRSKPGAASKVSLKELSQCIGMVKPADAVDPDSAAMEMPRAQMLAIASTGNLIVVVGAIKRCRPKYSFEIAEKSGMPFDPTSLELGYISIDAKYRGKRLSGRIVHKLLSGHEGALFATTSSERMKRTLAHAGFVQKGSAWEGRKEGRKN